MENSRRKVRDEDFFFVNKAKDFDIDKIEVPLGTKNLWNKRCRFASENPYRYIRHIEMLLDIIAFRKGIKILDVGSGIGTEIIELSYLGAHCIGLDVYKESVHLVNSVKDHFRLENIECFCGDGCNLPLKDETFDVVMSKEFLEHVRDPDLAIKEQIRVLKSGGRLIIEQANLLNPYVLFDLLIMYPIRTRGKCGGIRWLLTKSKVKENLYGHGWTGKDEDVHSRLWWRRKLKQYPEITILEFTSNLAKRDSKFLKILAPLIGNIVIVARKK